MASALFAACLALGAGAAPDIAIPHEKYTLAQNGLEVILSEDHALPIVAVDIWYHAGPVNEPPGRTGFAHLFEHLMFQGSKNVADSKLFQLLDGNGASIVNGSTDFDRTNYFETMPSNQLPLVLWLESDRMGFLLDTLTQAKLDNQRSVVMNERRQSVENEPYGPSDEALMHTLFPPGHPYYGNVIGSMDDLAAATLNDVRDFYTRYYAPANATLAIVGDIDKAATKELVARYFGTLASRPPPSPASVTTPPLTAERRVVVKEPVQLPRIAHAWMSPPAFKPGDAEADVLAFILGAGRSSRLYQRLVQELELAQSVSAQQQSLALTSVFYVTLVGRPGIDLARLEAEADKVVAELQQTPPTAREIERARNMLVTMTVGALQNIGGFGGKADTLNRYNQYIGDPGYLAKDLARYEAVTPAAIQSLAKTLLGREQRATVITVQP